VHDSEDLNGNGYLDRENAYYHFEIDLADSAIIDIQRDYPKDAYAEYWNAETVNQYKAWRLYRVSLANIEQALRSPSGLVPRTDAIQHFRIWLPSPASIEGHLGHLIETSMVRFPG
jgi:cell surface protein SprA